MNLHISFRCDASHILGSGHVVRCMELANQFRRRGCSCSFITNPAALDIVPALKVSGYNIYYEGMYPEDVDLCVIDHYLLDAEYEVFMKSQARYVCVIDDIQRKVHVCDFFIDQTPLLAAESLNFHTQAFLGMDYAILREKFLDLSESVHKRKSPPKRILAFFGSTDATGLALKFCNALDKISARFEHVDIVIGNEHFQSVQIQDFVARSTDISLHVQTSRMPELMMNSDIAFGSGGAAIWERLALHLPCIEIAHSMNQIPCLEALHKQGYVNFMGYHENVKLDMLVDRINEIANGGFEVDFSNLSIGRKMLYMVETILEQIG